MSVFEAGMLICFGLSWPISIVRTLRTKVVLGKSPYFTGIVVLGYLCGVAHKVVYSLDWVIYLYLFNLVVVSLDLILYFKYRGRLPEAG
ncbi:MAG: hypothetical protein LBH93_08775 [Chitinispirillales bacterium]|jgi:hypothetical protein|nr:hypothetical protein [Chitinispirillales bacterium]